MELVKQKPSYDYWLAKGILLLGDNFTARKIISMQNIVLKAF